jgi:hypothetical protein
MSASPNERIIVVGGGEDLGGQAQVARHHADGLLEPVGRRAVAVQRGGQREHEADRRALVGREGHGRRSLAARGQPVARARAGIS